MKILNKQLGYVINFGSPTFKAGSYSKFCSMELGIYRVVNEM